MGFFCRTRCGVFSIRPAANGRWALVMGSDALGFRPGQAGLLLRCDSRDLMGM